MSEKELEKLFRKRQLLIDAQQKRLQRKIVGFERLLFEKILRDLLEKLRTEDGIIKSGRNEIKLSEAIDKIFDSFNRTEGSALIKDISLDFKNLFTLNNQYYNGLFILSESRKLKFENITKSVQATMRKRIGLDEKGKLVKGGYFDSLIKSAPLRNAVKAEVFKAVTAEIGINQLVKSLKQLTIGTKTVPGSLTSYYKGAIFDVYQQFDRATNDEFAVSLNLSAFIYSGGLIETSREFCILKNDKVFTVDEANEWKKDKTLPKTKAERESGNVSGYIPTIDMGRWNCRHMVRYISKRMAIRMRPELAEYFEGKKAAA